MPDVEVEEAAAEGEAATAAAPAPRAAQPGGQHAARRRGVKRLTRRRTAAPLWLGRTCALAPRRARPETLEPSAPRPRRGEKEEEQGERGGKEEEEVE